MGKYIRPFVIFLLLLCIVAACDGNGNNNVTTRTIGPEGGTIKSSDGKLTLEIPAGALDEDTEISIRRVDQSEISEEFGDTDIDSAYELIPDGLIFNVPVRASVKLDEDPNQADGTLIADVAFLFSESGDVIEFLENTELEVDGPGSMTTASADLTHFTDLVTKTIDGVTVTLDMTKKEDIPNTFTGTVIVSSNTRIEGIFSEITNNTSGASLTDPSGFDNLPFSPSGGMSTGTINGKCLEEIETKEISIEILVEATDLATLFTFGFIRPPSAPDIGRDLIVIGFFTTRVEIVSEIVCKKTEEGDTPPPPLQPTEPPTEPPPPPVVTIADVEGEYLIDCISEPGQDPLGIIEGNLGNPVELNVIIQVNSSTGEVTITTTDGLFILTGMIVDQQNGTFVINAEGSGKLGDDANPTAANIVVKAVNWNFVVNELGDVIFTGGTMRFNFPGFPLGNQTSVASCFDEMAGE